MASADPATAVANAQEKIARFEIPRGYKPVSISILSYDVVNLLPQTSSSDMTIMLMQYSGPMTGSPDQMEEQLRQAAQRQNGAPGIPMHVVDVREETIRGRKVSVTVSEGTLQGFTMRQWISVFQGNNGPVIILAQGSLELWDDPLLEHFIASIE